MYKAVDDFLSASSLGDVASGATESIAVPLMRIFRIDEIRVAHPESFSISIAFKKHELDRSENPAPDGLAEIPATKLGEVGRFKAATAATTVTVTARNTGAEPRRFEVLLIGRTVR